MSKHFPAIAWAVPPISAAYTEFSGELPARSEGAEQRGTAVVDG
jgi:hypothetical protein